MCVAGQGPGSCAAGADGGCSFPGDLLLKPIVEVAGQDISHWFDPKTRDVSSAGTRGGVGGGMGPRDRGVGRKGGSWPQSEVVTAPRPLSRSLR